MNRPDNLPDFRKPPLNEVVIGIQFNSPESYQQIHAYEVWSLFQQKYPNVEEHPPLQPQFELFGQPQAPTINFGLITGAVHDRFLFINEKSNELIQFQKDRLLHNWRKNSNDDAEYPRYERMIEAFTSEASALFDYFEKFDGRTPDINQCEISYLNTIPMPDGSKPSDWLRILNFGELEPNDFTFSSRRTIFDNEGTPEGRLLVDAMIGYSPEGSKALLLNLTARGKPADTTLRSALEFFAKNREMIVKAFAELTTDSAHTEWERV